MSIRGYFSPYELERGRESVNYIQAHYRENPTISHLCSVSGINEKLLQALIKSLTGLSVHQYIEQYRLTSAIADLANPEKMDLTISAIAKNHGYGSDTYFYRVFRKKMGQTPEDYRASIIAGIPGR